jgi:glycoside/pentoside/hexuronide:cation symporter, GPH family
VTSAVALPAWRLAAYASFAFPLSMAALPIYVQVPAYYAATTSLSLATIGALLLGVRALDAVQDPWLGALSDRYRTRTGSRLGLVGWSAPGLALGMVALFLPPSGSAAAALWLVATLAVTYLAYSAGSIAYLAHGAEMSGEYHQRTRIVAIREGVGLAGVIVAAVLPDALATRYGLVDGQLRFAVLFGAAAIAGAWIAVRAAPRSPRPAATVAATPLAASLRAALADRRFRRLAAIYALNGIAAAVPATLVLFYVRDALGVSGAPGVFLAVYFASAAVGMPLWVATARRTGKANAWLVSMLLSIAAFGWTWALGRGDTAAFACICVLTGIALGADLALPPALLADVADGGGQPDDAPHRGAYFGVWTLLAKLNLGLAAGLSLPLVGLLGYLPGTSVADGARALSLVYALLPCALKTLAAVALWRWRTAIDPPVGRSPLAGESRP